MHVEPDVLDRALLELASGEPDWVMVDRRVLRLLLGPLTDLIVQVPVQDPGPLARSVLRTMTRPDHDPDRDGFVWDEDELC